MGSRGNVPWRPRWFTLSLDLPRGALAVVEHLPPYVAMAALMGRTCDETLVLDVLAL